MSEEQEFHESRKDSEPFGRLQNDSEGFGTFRNDAERFGSVPKSSERKQGHTLTVREATRMFEEAGVPRTERSIINWCQPNRTGVARLDCYFDPNEHKYFITPQSVTLAIREEQAKASKSTTTAAPEAVPKASESSTAGSSPEMTADAADVKALKQELMDLKITNRGKDYFIEQLQKEREAFGIEREGYVEKLMNFNRKVGELETKLLQLRPPE